VQQYVLVLVADVKYFPVQSHLIAVRIDTGGQLGYSRAVDGDPALQNELFTLAARGQTGVPEEPIEANDP
jgi:hypothetical protein